MRTSMKAIGSLSGLAMAVALLAAPVAFAQNGGNTAGGGLNAPAASSSPGAPMQAPVGHLQPRRDPALDERSMAQPSAEEKALDRKIKSICRGC